MDVFNNLNTGKNANIDLSNLSNIGKQQIKSIAGGGQPVGTVNSVNNVGPVNTNVSLNTDNIPQGLFNKYVNGASINDLNDVFINTPAQLDTLKWNGVNQWINEPPFLSDCSDTNINTPTDNQFLRYDIATNFWVNETVNTDTIPPGITNKYFTTQQLTDYLLNLITNYGILYNNNGNLDSLLGAEGTYLRAGTNHVPAFSQVRMREILEHSTMVREETINIPANGFTNMLDWIQNSNIFNELIIPNGLQDINPYFWGTRGTADYGMWKIQNNSANPQTITRVNLIPSAIFIIFQFIRTLILNIMDDNLNNGTVRVRINGINTRQTGGTVQIFNDEGDIDLQLGKTRTLTAGANITLIQNADTITISSSAGVTNLSALNDVSITAIANNQFLQYNSTSTKWENKTITSDDITQGVTNKYYSNAQVDTYLKTILTTNEDILIRRNNNITRLPVSVNTGDILKYNGVSGEIEWGAPAPAVASLATLNDVLILNDPIQSKSFLMYDPSNGTGVANFWVDSIAQIADITGLQTALDGKLNNIFGAYGQLMIGSGGSTYQTFPKGVNNDFLQIQGGFLEWNPITIAKVDNLQTTLDGKINTNILTTAGDLLYHDGNTGVAKLPRGTPGQILRVNGGGTNIGWENQVVVKNFLSELNDCNIGVGTLVNNQALIYNTTSEKWENKTITIAKVQDLQTTLDGKINTNVLTNNGDILVRSAGVPSRLGIGADNKVLSVNGGAVSWESLALNGSYFSNISQTPPTAGQVLSWNNGNNRYEPSNSLGFPLLAPNGTAANPSYSFVNATNTGFWGQAGGVMNLSVGGVLHSSYTGTQWRLFQQMYINGFTGIVSTVGSARTASDAKFTFSNGGGTIAIDGDGFNNNMIFITGDTVRLAINNTRTQVQRLDIKNTQIDDFRLSINNAVNAFSITNNANTTEYFKVDTANDNVTIPRNKYFQAYLMDNLIGTNIPANGQTTTLNLGGNLVQTSGSIAPVLCTFNGLASEFTILKAGVYKVDFNAVYLPDNSSDNSEMFINSNVGTYPAAWKRTRAADGQYTQVTISFIHTFGANDIMFIAFRCAQNAPFTVNLTSWSLNITNLLVS